MAEKKDKIEEKGGKKGFLQNLSFVKKLKTIKHIEIIVLVLAAALVGIILMSSFKSDSDSDSGSSISGVNYDNYATELETKLGNILSGIKNAGTVNVMVTLDGGPTYEIAYSTEERTSGTGTSGSSTIIKTPIIVTKNGSSGPLILKEIPPAVKGVVVVAQGASDVKVKLELIKATQAALQIEVAYIEVFTGK